MLDANLFNNPVMMAMVDRMQWVDQLLEGIDPNAPPAVQTAKSIIRFSDVLKEDCVLLPTSWARDVTTAYPIAKESRLS